MNVLDLFSGIGGFSLGLERAGMRTVAFCEIDPYCRAVLAKHWPDVPVYGDVRELTGARLVADAHGAEWRQDNSSRRSIQWSDGLPQWEESSGRSKSSGQIDLICGGFPCQDISVAGKGAGIAGERSGLWSEYARIIGEVRPRYVIVENVAALLGRGLDRVLGDLAALGFDAEWHCIPASAVGAPHRRDRLWIIAYPNSGPIRKQSIGVGGSKGAPQVAESVGARLALGTGTLREWAHAATTGTGWWAVEPDVCRVAHGVPARVDRLRSLGNAVVPQIPEIIGRALMKHEEHAQS